MMMMMMSSRTIQQTSRLGSRIRMSAVSALCGTFLACEPPTLPADTAAKRLVDRLLPREGWPSYLYFAGVAGLWVLSVILAGRAGLAVATLASFAGGGWCIANFWRCRHAHCVVTGVGWLALAALAMVETVLGHSLISGLEAVAFLVVLGLGILFEFGWYLASDTATVISRNASRIPAGQIAAAPVRVPANRT